VYLYAAANGLATVIRAWIDRDAIAEAVGLTPDQRVLFSPTVGYPENRVFHAWWKDYSRTLKNASIRCDRR
jgi:hypothetical protein